jgi:hypothetical protein
VGSVAADRSPHKQQLEGLLTLDDHAVIGFEWGVGPSGPELTLFEVHLGAASSTLEAFQQQGGIVQCFTYVVEDWTERFDQLFDRYFAAAA